MCGLCWRCSWRFPPDFSGARAQQARAHADGDPSGVTALAAPLVVLAILSAIVTNEVKGRLVRLMMAFYLLNTM